MLTVLVGGARSGKSSLALELAFEHAASGGEVTVVATAPRIDDDADLDARIRTHRAERPPEWRTIEEQHDLVGALERCGTSFVIVDCVTLWVNNLLWRGDDPALVEDAAQRAAAFAASRAAATVVVSNEVGLGIHPASEAGRSFRDLLGRVNATWARSADRALLMVAGRAVALHDPRSLL